MDQCCTLHYDQEHFLGLHTSFLGYLLQERNKSLISRAKGGCSGTQAVSALLRLDEKTEQKNCWVSAKERAALMMKENRGGETGLGWPVWTEWGEWPC